MDSRLSISLPTQKNKRGISSDTLDLVAIEEPLEIRLGFTHQGQRLEKSLSITMRTPGNDEELAAGFLFTEGIIKNQKEIASLKSCGPKTGAHAGQNIVRVELEPNCHPPLENLTRNFYTTSSCGICGKSSLELLENQGLQPVVSSLKVNREILSSLPLRLEKAQATFAETGGIHAAGLFDATGNLIASREDVGRHNAVDKLIGHFFLKEKLPLADFLILVSGRASFELMQKSLMAGIPMLVAVGAPSSLAVDLAKRFQMTLIGFCRGDRYNVYSCPERIQ